MSSELSRSSSPKWIAAAVALMFASGVIGCVGPDAFDRDAGPIQTGAGGNDGFAGQTGNGGSGMGGAAMGGRTGSGGAGTGGKTGTGGSGMGGAPGAGGSSAGGRTGSGGSAMGGAPGTGGRGMGGATGMGGAVVTDGGSDGDAAGAGGMMGTGGAGGGTVVFSDDFESDAIAATQPANWTRLGGSGGDFQIVLDGSHVLTQNKASTGTTYRACYASGAPGAPWTAATTASAQVKVTAIGTTPTALFCLRYTTGNAGYCIALLPNNGAQIQVRAADVASASSAVTPMTIAVGTQYSVQISVDATGVLSGSVNGMAVGPLTPTGTAITSGFVGVATQMATATFDNVVVTQP